MKKNNIIMSGIENLSFRPALIPTMIAGITTLLLVYLGFWQLERASYKEAEFESYQLNAALDPIVLNEYKIIGVDRSNLQWRKVEITGRYAGAATYLLDNQVENGVAGYHVYTPFNLVNTDIWVLMNRGWVAGGTYRDRLPEIVTPGGELTLTGDIYLSQHLMILGDVTDEVFGQGIKRVQDINLEKIRISLGYNLVPFLIRLAPTSPSGYLRKWPEPGSGRERHMGYAFQWFLLATVLVILCFLANIQRSQENNDQQNDN
jgi:surfeit locus 1 family protein